MMMGDMGPLLAGSAIFSLLLVVTANVVRRVSANHPDGRHWLLGTLALLSPTSLLAGVAVGVVGPHLLSGNGPVSSTSAIWMTAMVLILIGALSAPVSWRVVLQQRLGRASGSLPFFYATRAQLWALFLLAVVYMSTIHLASTNLPEWLLEPGALPVAVRAVMQVVHVALLSAMLTLPAMALRTVANRSVRRVRALLHRTPQG
ncbi:hypothetical protein [Stenotrophomonas indicatrix]|uniref:hypothetical protein n=1 Tax=Stenotrophomonas indicatrix TaxID=2045451 RepID=UPI0007394FCD|nr:hypothetical protein [Stenotrophomonas indicatrix]MDN8647810.1 hypothetical protein [Stenotrophomonas indicatrix]CRD47707.1 putative transmembrane protein [Stenotrophomonas indicatrix]